jgi:phytoene dehydrogenase-like protein
MPKVTIIGGGLAGMTSALRLLEQGFEVTLYEGRERLGGEAGSNTVEGRYEDHGYHIFPMYYLNTWKIIDELGIRNNFVPIPNFNQLKAGEYPHIETLVNFASASTFWKNLTSGFEPFSSMFIFYYTMLDLMSRRDGTKFTLDEVSVEGFIYARFYKDSASDILLREMLLKAASAAPDNLSAMTLKRILSLWVKYPVPSYYIPANSLQQSFISPLEQRLRDKGCQIHFNHWLEKIHVSDGKVSRLSLVDKINNQPVEVEIDRLIMAIPLSDWTPLFDDALYQTAQGLFNIDYLAAEPMAALSIYCRSKIDGMPKEHISLYEAKYALSCIDVSQTWPGLPNTVLNVIVSDFTALKELTKDAILKAVLTEMRRFIPALTDDNIEEIYLQTHIQEPLAMNYVGSWIYRPDPNKASQLPNLYVAGTFTQTWVNLVTMEGAVESGVRAAEALRRDAGVGSPIEILEGDLYPRWLMVIARILAFPLVLIAKFFSLIRGN